MRTLLNCSASPIAFANVHKVNMPNDAHSSFSIGATYDWLSSRFIAFGLPAGQDEKRTERLSRPALLYSRSMTLGACPERSRRAPQRCSILHWAIEILS